MTTRLGCIADDFTGATDLAGLLARGGLPVSLRIGVPDTSPVAGDTSLIEVIALGTRTLPVAEAVAQSRAALEWLRTAGAKRFYQKYCSTFDSTPAGNIGPVAEALMQDLGLDQTLYCPAFPENGRLVFMGNLFMGDLPLAESPMKDHPLTPMRDSNLLRVLSPQVTMPVGLLAQPTVAAGSAAVQTRLDELRTAGVAHVIVDAISNADLATIADACRDMVLTTGGSALAASLMRDDGRNPSPVQRPAVGPGQIVLSGSCSAMTNAQVAAYLPKAASYKLDPVALANGGLPAACAWLAAQDPDAPKIIYATAAPDDVKAAQAQLGVGAAGHIVEQALATLAADAFTLGVRRFVVAGGETSNAVTRALGVARLTIGAEIATGVPWTFAEKGGDAVGLALKSGNFGAVGFFTDAFSMLPA